MGKSDRAAAVGALALVLALWPRAAAAAPWVLAALALLCAATCRNRLAATLVELRREAR